MPGAVANGFVLGALVAPNEKLGAGEFEAAGVVDPKLKPADEVGFATS